jgi:7-carboxy-7-deazaguanine synthase
MNIVEIFYSLQGEGRLIGVPSVFIRVAGCTVRCAWCDTKYAWDESAGEDFSIDEILHRVDNLPPTSASSTQNSFIVVTGGEPITNNSISLLLKKLSQTDRHITVETSGIEFIQDLPVDLMSISPKLDHNHRQTIRQLIRHYDYQLKFVIDAEDDIAKVKAAVDSIKEIDRNKVMLMPQAKTRKELLAKSPMVAKLCKQYGFTFCPRLHIILWDGQLGR